MVYLSFINMYTLSGTKTSGGFVSDLKQQKMVLPPRNFLGPKKLKIHLNFVVSFKTQNL